MMTANPTHVPNPVIVNDLLYIEGIGATFYGWETDGGGPIEAPLDSALVEGPLFTVNAGAKLEVHGLSFTGSGSTYSGSYPLILAARGQTLIFDSELSNHGTTGNGGAIRQTGGTVELLGSAAIRNCRAANGAGLYVSGGEALLNEGTIYLNTATGSGGGVYVADGGTATIGGTTIGHTSPDNRNTAQKGGGVYVQATDEFNRGTITMTGGSIGYNFADISGGGVYLEGGTFTIQGGQIIGNTATDGHGGGVWMNAGAAVPGRIDFRHDSQPLCITDNRATNGLGGGVWNQTPSVEPFQRFGTAITTVEKNTFIASNASISHQVFDNYNDALYQFTETLIGTTDTVYRNGPTQFAVKLVHAGTETPSIEMVKIDPSDVTTPITLTQTDNQAYRSEWAYTESTFGMQGTYIFQITAQYGAASLNADRTVVYDTTLPVVNVNPYGLAAGYFGANPTGTAADTGSGLDAVEFSTDGGTVWLPCTGIASWTASSAWLEGSPYTIQFRARDFAGNISAPISQTLVYDTMLPVIAGPITLGSYEDVAGMQFLVTVNGMSDTGSGLAQIQVTGGDWALGPVTKVLSPAQASETLTVISGSTPGTYTTVNLTLTDLAGRTFSGPVALQSTLTLTSP